MTTKRCKRCGCFIGKKEHNCEKIWKKMSKNHPNQFGENNPMFGKKQSVESNLKRSNTLKKKRKGKLNPFFGKHHTEQWKKELKENKERSKKISLKKKGKKLPPFTKEHKRKIGDKHRGKIVSLETRRKIRKHRIEEIKKNGYISQIGKNEKQYLDEIELSLGYKIIRQFLICDYFVDGYIPELNLVIEIDEKHHFDIDGNRKLKDIQRQKDIEKELNCKFIRINDN